MGILESIGLLGMNKTSQPAPEEVTLTRVESHDLRQLFQVAGATVMGSAHFKPLVLRNCQDAVHWSISREVLTGIVCDGCSSGMPDNSHSHTEIGAQIGSRLLVHELQVQFGHLNRGGQSTDQEEDVARVLERVRQNVLARIRMLAVDMTSTESGESLTMLLTNYFMFTVVGAVIGPQYTYLFNLGDGTLMVNGESLRLGPFPENKPPYLGYGLTGSTLDPNLLKFSIQAILPTAEVYSILLGSDAVVEEYIPQQDTPLPFKTELLGPISDLWTNDAFFKNPDALRRRLAQANREFPNNSIGSIIRQKALFDDDLSALIIRRKPVQE